MSFFDKINNILIVCRINPQERDLREFYVQRFGSAKEMSYSAFN